LIATICWPTLRPLPRRWWTTLHVGSRSGRFFGRSEPKEIGYGYPCLSQGRSRLQVSNLPLVVIKVLKPCSDGEILCVCVCVCVCARARACVCFSRNEKPCFLELRNRVRARACVRMCVCVCARVFSIFSGLRNRGAFVVADPCLTYFRLSCRRLRS
jgi:hypothetical protein